MSRAQPAPVVDSAVFGDPGFVVPITQLMRRGVSFRRLPRPHERSTSDIIHDIVKELTCL